MKLIHSALLMITLTSVVMGSKWANAPADAAAGAAKSVKSPELQFAVISDIHVQHWDQASHLRFQQALNDLSVVRPDAHALVINGDLGNGLPADYDMLGKLMSIAPHPDQVYYTIGNHDYYKAWLDSLGNWNANRFPNEETEADSINRFLRFTGYSKVYHDTWVEEYHFIFLGSEAYQQSDPLNGEDAWLSEEQLQWLDWELGEQAEAEKPIFVFLHQPLPGTVAGSKSPVNNRAVIQHERLRDILSRHPQTILFTGHSHWELASADTLVRDGFTMVNTSSVYEPFTEEDLPYAEGEQMSEGLTVDVFKDEVRIRGRSFVKQQWVEAADFRLPLKQAKNSR